MQHIKRSIEVVRRNGIRFIPIATDDTAMGSEPNKIPSPGHLSENIEERVALLTQMVYVEVTFYLLGKPTVILAGFTNPGKQTTECPVRLRVVSRILF